MKLDPVLMLRAGPGTLPRWVRWSISVASIVTVIAIALGGSLVAGELHWEGRPPFWISSGFALAAGLAIVVAFVPPAKLSRFVRLAVVLPVIHGVLIGIGWYVWQDQSDALWQFSDGRAFASWFPFVATTILGGVIYVAAAVLVARKHEWVHALTTLALSALLLVGLWLPLACARLAEYRHLLPHPARAVTLIVLPPLLAAMWFTYVSLRKPVAAAKPAVVILLAFAVLFRSTAGAHAMVLYGNFVPVLLVAALLAAGSLAVMAIATVVRGSVARQRFVGHERLVGVVDCTRQEPVIALELASWLRGPRVVQRPFAIATSAGTIPVSGAELVAPLPPATTLLAVGEMIGILHGGDLVIVAGQRADDGDPFRTSASPLSGELSLAPADVERAGLTSMTLAMWRPCVAYLLIITAVAVPGLAALLS